MSTLSFQEFRRHYNHKLYAILAKADSVTKIEIGIFRWVGHWKDGNIDGAAHDRYEWGNLLNKARTDFRPWSKSRYRVLAWPAELIKHGVESLYKVIYEVLLLVWEQEEMQEDWRKGISMTEASLCYAHSKGPVFDHFAAYSHCDLRLKKAPQNKNSKRVKSHHFGDQFKSPRRSAR